MPFFTKNNANINFLTQNLQYRFYTTGDILLTIRIVELIEKKEFAEIAFKSKYKTFVRYVATPNINSDINYKVNL